MQTKIQPFFKQTVDGKEADAILRRCVHCGFCNATCPTYLELGDERDGPRGRIYLIKQLLEQGHASERTRRHLDRCLSCRSCETTCPSGVEFGRLLDIGRNIIEHQQSRPVLENLFRKSLLAILPYKNRFNFLLKIGRALAPILPAPLKDKLPPKQTLAPARQKSHTRKMLLLSGCVQPGTTPNTNAASKRVFDRLGINLIEAKNETCCGAMSYHLSAQEQAKKFMRRNIDAWWPAVQQGAEAIVITASGCGSMIKDYGHLFQHEPEYAHKARRISALSKDLSEILIEQDLSILRATAKNRGQTTAIHCPCSLQHGQQLAQNVPTILSKLGFKITATEEDHLCCGSAGSYSLLQTKMSQTLLTNKIRALTKNNPDQIVTANVGCQLHIASKSPVPVLHWIELLDHLTTSVQ